MRTWDKKHFILKGCKTFHKGELKREGRNMHFNARAASHTLVELISSVNDFGIIYGML